MKKSLQRKGLRLFTFSLLFALSFISASYSNFQTNGEKRIGSQLLNIKLTDEFEKEVQLSDWKGTPFFLHPMFAACKSTCPMMTKNLVESFKEFGDFGKDFKVLSLSFDPAEKPKSLKEFRKTHGLPSGWSLAFGEESQVRSLLDSLDFRYVKTGGENFAHSNLLVLVDSEFKVRDYLYGASISFSQLKSALESLSKEERKSENQWMIWITAILVLMEVTLVVLTARIPQFLWKRLSSSTSD